MTVGWIYILVNATIRDLVKIGKTSRSPYDRAAELSSTTGVPTPFAVAYAVEVSDIDAAEQDIHQDLMYCRNSHEREFFSIKVWDAIHALQRISTKYEINSKEEKNHIYVIKIHQNNNIWSRIGCTNLDSESLINLFKNKDRNFYIDFFLHSDHSREVVEYLNNKYNSNDRCIIYNLEFRLIEKTHISIVIYDAIDKFKAISKERDLKLEYEKTHPSTYWNDV